MNLTPEQITASSVALGSIGFGIKYLLDRKDRLYLQQLDRKDKEHQQELDKLNLMNLTSKVNLNILYNLQKLRIYGRLLDFSKELFKLFSADRFLVLLAVNGKTDPNIVSAVFGEESEEYKTKIDIEERYIQVPIDAQYKEMLRVIQRVGYVILVVDEMPECKLKEFYQGEKVKYSLVFFLKRYHLNENDDAVLFCSLAVHKLISWSVSEIQTILSLVKSRAIPLLDKIVK